MFQVRWVTLIPVWEVFTAGIPTMGCIELAEGITSRMDIITTITHTEIHITFSIIRTIQLINIIRLICIILLTRCPHSHVNCWNQNKKTESITGFRLFDFHPFRRVPSMINEISVPSFVERCNNISDSIWTAGQCSRRTSLACSICASIKFPNSSGLLTKGNAASTACSRSLSVPSSGRSPQRQSFLQLPRPLKLEDCLIIWG